jgi:hydrogenase nickel incorporation protein HypA/HybF
MHELSIVLSIVETAEEIVRQEAATKVDTIELEIGAIAGIEMSAFEFSWKPAVLQTVLENAQCIVHNLPALLRCSNCGREYEAAERFAPCPDCSEILSAVLRGKELAIKSLIVS